MQNMEKAHPDVSNPDEYDGRNFVGPDDRDGVSNYVGVDPIYQTYANEGEKPHPFSKEELDEAARRAGLDPEEEAKTRAAQEDSDDASTGEDPEEKSSSAATTKKAAATPPPPKAPATGTSKSSSK